jgi:hypothetical protein
MRSEQEMLDIVRGKVIRLRRRRRMAVGSGAVLALVVVVGGGMGLAAAAGGGDDKQVTYTADQPPDTTEVSPDTTDVSPDTTQPPPPSGETVVMPDVTGLDAAAATQILQEVGLGGGERAVELHHTASADVAAETVLSQSPAPGAAVSLGDSVVLEVSSGG